MRSSAVLALLLLAPRAQAAEPQVVTLDELLRRATRDNPVVAVQRADLAQKVALFDRAYYAWTPTLKVESLLAPLPERRELRECVLGVNEDGLEEIGPCPGQDLETDERITPDTEIGILTRTTAKLTFPIYTFGKIEAGQRAARANVEVGEGSLEAARWGISYLVKRAYFGAQLAAASLDILEDGQKRMAKARRDVQKDLDKQGGRFDGNDLRKLVVEDAELQIGVNETRNLDRLAWEGLRIAGGFGRGEPFRLDSTDLEPVRLEPRTLEAYLELATAGRADLRIAAAAVRARQAQVDMASAALYPNVALVAGFGFAKGTTADDPADPYASDSYNFLSWGVVLGLEWKLDFASLVSELNQSEAVLVKQRAQLAALMQKVELEVTELSGLVTRYGEELSLRETIVKNRKAMLVSETLNFGIGTANTDDLVKALVNYSKARLAYFKAIYEYNLAVARLSGAVGAELVVPGEQDD